MPELPEVENIKRTLSLEVKKGDVLIDITFLRKDLRFQIPTTKLLKLIDHKFLEISRRGNYHSKIKSSILSGRATYWCPSCQK